MLYNISKAFAMEWTLWFKCWTPDQVLDTRSNTPHTFDLVFRHFLSSYCNENIYSSRKLHFDRCSFSFRWGSLALIQILIQSYTFVFDTMRTVVKSKQILLKMLKFFITYVGYFYKNCDLFDYYRIEFEINCISFRS